MKKQVYLILTIVVILGFFSCKTMVSSKTLPDKALLTQIKKDLRLGFSDITKTDFTWIKTKAGAQADGTQIKGFKISAEITLNGDYSLLNEKANIAANYLISKGFTADQKNFSEIASGYEKDNLACLVITQSDPDSELHAYLIIKCGRLD